MKFNNPIIPGFYPDPSICRVDEDYYLVTSSFEYYPGVPIFHSKDLINWQQIGYCLKNYKQLLLKNAKCSGGIYAPTIRYNNGMFYMTTTNVSHGGNFYVTAKDPAGEWSDPIFVEMSGIDPTMFFDDDGKVYYMTNAGLEDKSGIVAAEIEIATGKLISEINFLWAGSGGRCVESPHIYKVNGLYYLLAAEGGTQYGHMVTISRSEHIFGEYQGYSKNPILTHRDYNSSIIQGTGHGDFVMDYTGHWWMVFLAFRNSTRLFHHLGRETFIAPVNWNEDGWPIVNTTGTVELETEADCLPQYEFSKSDIRDNFDDIKLNYCWNFLRNPYKECYSLSHRKGWITLYGNKFSLNDIDSPTFLCRRQQHFNCRVETLLEFEPNISEQEAGLAVFYNNEHHYEIAVTIIDNERHIIVRRTIGDLSAVVAKEKIKDGQIFLQITADAEKYYFAYRQNKEHFKELASGRTQFLSTEATKVSFTGVFFGIYSTCSGKPCNNPAYFDWFDYEPTFM